MKKNLLLTFLACLLLLAFALPASAEDGFYSAYDRFMDTAQLVSDSQRETIGAKLDELSARQRFDLVVVTAENIGDYDSVEPFADDLFDSCDFGYGDDRDGALLVISTGTGDCYLSTHGYGIYVFTDYGIQFLLEQLRPALEEGDFNGAIELFIDLADNFIEQARNGEHYSKRNLPRQPFSPMYIVVSAAIGIFAAFFIVGGMKAKLKTVRPATRAADYVRRDSLNLSDSRDLFLYSSVTQTPRPQSSDSDGSSTHTSSSGETHGGGGIKF